MYANYDRTVTGAFNFARDKQGGGEFSNTRPERSRQDMRSVEVEIRNARAWPQAPSLEREGLTITDHEVPEQDWSDRKWIEGVYVPSCIELVKRVTGASQAVSLYPALVRRVDYEAHRGSAPTAAFLHLDQPRDTARELGQQRSSAAGLNLEKGIIYNVWKCLTPPPQDYPLAVADRRSIPEADMVYGETVEYLGEGDEEFKFVSPYYAMLPSDKHVFYYYPDMVPEESLLFIGADLDESHPLGCAHAAFKHPAPDGECVPRASVEVRILALFD